MRELEIFRNRLSKIGIEVDLIANYPWVYIIKINGDSVKERYEGNHGFTVGFLSAKRDDGFKFTNITEIFKLIRKYEKRDKVYS